MSYIDLINRFWKYHEAYSFSAVEIGLYFKLLDIANKMRWQQEKLYIPMMRLQTELDTCKSSVLKARKRLEDAGLIVIQPGHGNRQSAGYQINGVEDIVQKEGVQMNQGLNEPGNKKDGVSPATKKSKTIHETDRVPYHGRTDDHKDDRTNDHTRDPYIRLYQDKDQEIDTDQMKMMINDHSGEEMSKERENVVLDCEDIVQMFNGICTSLKKVHTPPPTIREKLNQRMKDFKTKEQWEAYFTKVAQSTFLCGPNQYGWQADLFWLIKDSDTPKRILEGKYDERDRGISGQYDPVRGACYTNADFGNDNDLVDELAEVASS
ncbi:MAG: hypothetical protein U9N62_07720 [Thermotogota bacterium]|nr:hypothetical protein [Thermotogota bacterium]